MSVSARPTTTQNAQSTTASNNPSASSNSPQSSKSATPESTQALQTSSGDTRDKFKLDGDQFVASVSSTLAKHGYRLSDAVVCGAKMYVFCTTPKSKPFTPCVVEIDVSSQTIPSQIHKSQYINPKDLVNSIEPDLPNVFKYLCVSDTNKSYDSIDDVSRIQEIGRSLAQFKRFESFTAGTDVRLCTVCSGYMFVQTHAPDSSVPSEYKQYSRISIYKLPLRMDTRSICALSVILPIQKYIEYSGSENLLAHIHRSIVSKSIMQSLYELSAAVPGVVAAVYLKLDKYFSMVRELDSMRSECYTILSASSFSRLDIVPVIDDIMERAGEICISWARMLLAFESCVYENMVYCKRIKHNTLLVEKCQN